MPERTGRVRPVGDFLSEGGQVRTVSPVDVKAVGGPKSLENKPSVHHPASSLPGKLSGPYTKLSDALEIVPLKMHFAERTPNFGRERDGTRIRTRQPVNSHAAARHPQSLGALLGAELPRQHHYSSNPISTRNGANPERTRRNDRNARQNQHN
jgi:hypothetical protein